MGTLHNVLHTSARPIGLPEFIDALHATCPPRFPHTKGLNHRRVGVAVSGGVDSMALAWLCTQLRKYNPELKISDNPVSGFRGFIVDHGLRDGSQKEAAAVYASLKAMDFVSEIVPISWSRAIGPTKSPRDLSNAESLARTLRYQKLGSSCAFRHIASLFLAHHEDDQYETVLMRLLRGHGSRGLRGMRKANDIPECEGIYGAHRSGFVDDQKSDDPYYKIGPTGRERKHLHRSIRADIGRLMLEAEMDDHPQMELSDNVLEDVYRERRTVYVEPSNMEIEDGGLMVYRPLLEFSKDRLIATCLENKIPWFEDPTNKDPTLTMRNAVRSLYKGYSLPKALQKPAILAMSRKCEERAQAQEEEVDRLLGRTIVHEFAPHAGTITVQFPKIKRLNKRDSRSPLRRKIRLLKQRELAAILMRRFIALVSPEPQAPLLATLENHVTRLFPGLSKRGEAIVDPPKAFSLSSVFFVPVVSNSGPASAKDQTVITDQHQQMSWYLSRTPYPSHVPRPRVRAIYWAIKRNRANQIYEMSPPMQWELWDGRYWFHVEHRLPYRVIVQPFLPEHAKPFRENLHPEDRDRLAGFLKRYAPGKVRFTLPAIYLEEDLDLDPEKFKVRRRYPEPIAWDYRDGVGDGRGKDRGVEGGNGDMREVSMHPKVPDTSKMKLLALPTLDIEIPRLSEWLQYDIRYRNVDRNTLRSTNKPQRLTFLAPWSSSAGKIRMAWRTKSGRFTRRRRKGLMKLTVPKSKKAPKVLPS
ncbi:adenine nucleotide alpha hydrolases-like protein [Jackrogersella minutella]|nr:adenine nucleotide alpha hydrolases-like protein [Jackrogersella minutella]